MTEQLHLKDVLGPFYFQFSPDEHASLMAALKKYPRQKAESFVSFLRMEVVQYLALKSPEHVAQTRREIKAILGRMSKTIADLDSILFGGLDIIPQRTFSDLNPKQWNEIGPGFREAEAAKESLLKVIKTLEAALVYLEERKPAEGRQDRGSDGFLLTIGELFKQFLGQPTGYVNGAFANVVEITLTAINSRNAGKNIPDTLPERAIKRIAKQLKN